MKMMVLANVGNVGGYGFGCGCGCGCGCDRDVVWARPINRRQALLALGIQGWASIDCSEHKSPPSNIWQRRWCRKKSIWLARYVKKENSNPVAGQGHSEEECKREGKNHGLVSTNGKSGTWFPFFPAGYGGGHLLLSFLRATTALTRQDYPLYYYH